MTSLPRPKSQRTQWDPRHSRAQSPHLRSGANPGVAYQDQGPRVCQQSPEKTKTLPLPSMSWGEEGSPKHPVPTPCSEDLKCQREKVTDGQICGVEQEPVVVLGRGGGCWDPTQTGGVTSWAGHPEPCGFSPPLLSFPLAPTARGGLGCLLAQCPRDNPHTPPNCCCPALGGSPASLGVVATP